MLARPATLRVYNSSVGEQGRDDGDPKGGGDLCEGIDGDTQSLEIRNILERVSSSLVNVGVQVDGSEHQDGGEDPGQNKKGKVKGKYPCRPLAIAQQLLVLGQACLATRRVVCHGAD